MPDITVLTSITAGKDRLSDDQVAEGAKFVAYVSDRAPSAVWEQRDAHTESSSSRRNSRAPKMLSHKYCDTLHSLWIDGNISLRLSAPDIVREWLKDHDLAVFKHPERNCIYDEASFCASLLLDDPAIIGAQAEKYRKLGYPPGNGLAECSCIARRHTPEVEKFNEMWWQEYNDGSVRDQLSFMFVAAKSGIRINWISPSARCGHRFFKYRPHRTPQPEPGMYLDREIAKASAARWKALAEQRRERDRRFAEEMNRNALRYDVKFSTSS